MDSTETEDNAKNLNEEFKKIMEVMWYETS